jgi:hypothetical protein
VWAESLGSGLPGRADFPLSALWVTLAELFVLNRYRVRAM